MSTRKSRKPGYRPSLDAARTRKLTVGAQFKNSLQILMERMTSATPIFIRCLKPNYLKVPGSFDEKYIRQQLLYTGMLQTTKIRRDGYAIRPSFEDFIDKYKVILRKPELANTRDSCINILKATPIRDWQVGKSKVFLKYFHIDQLADMLKAMGTSAIIIQKTFRGFLGRRKAACMLKAAKKQAEQVNELLKQIDLLSRQMVNQQITAVQYDTSMPHSDVSVDGPPCSAGDTLPPPLPESICTALSPSNGAIIDQVKPANTKTFVEYGTQADDEEECEISDDEFTPIPSTSHPGNKMASVRWFQDTQATEVYDPSRQNFIAEWFHGVITRRQSENLLRQKQVGTYLIRVSESRFGYTLSFRAEDRARHYMIDQLRNKKFIIVGESKVHKSLKDLIDYHKNKKISNWNGYLEYPCGQESGECDYQELVNDKFYFSLEEQIRRQTVRISGIRENRALHPLPSTSAISRTQHPLTSKAAASTAPPIPDRNYSYASTANTNRPLPKPPTYIGLPRRQNQEPQHSRAGKK